MTRLPVCLVVHGLERSPQEWPVIVDEKIKQFSSIVNIRYVMVVNTNDTEQKAKLEDVMVPRTLTTHIDTVIEYVDADYCESAFERCRNIALYTLIVSESITVHCEQTDEFLVGGSPQFDAVSFMVRNEASRMFYNDEVRIVDNVLPWRYDLVLAQFVEHGTRVIRANGVYASPSNECMNTCDKSDHIAKIWQRCTEHGDDVLEQQLFFACARAIGLCSDVTLTKAQMHKMYEHIRGASLPPDVMYSVNMFMYVLNDRTELHWLQKCSSLRTGRAEHVVMLYEHLQRVDDADFDISIHSVDVRNDHEQKQVRLDVELCRHPLTHDFILPWYSRKASLMRRGMVFDCLCRCSDEMFIELSRRASTKKMLKDTFDDLDGVDLQYILAAWNRMHKLNVLISLAIGEAEASCVRSAIESSRSSSSKVALPHTYFTPPYETKMSPRIIMTITSCKRLYLFKETVESILRAWKDISLVDRIVCVDDNSSEADRHEMVKAYPWMSFIMKPPHEKGHRQSMNIIVNDVLRRYQPEYWIQMEDDWFFHQHDTYVSRARDILAKYSDAERVRQVVFNRAYEEKFQWTHTHAGRRLDSFNASKIHHYDPHSPYSRYHFEWWPHFSLNPSMVDARTVVTSCSNFEGPDENFEWRFAHKYHVKLGFKTAYLDQISCTNIGKKRHDDVGENAYSLNGIQQYHM